MTKSAHPYRSIPLLAVVLVALAVHGPLLFMRLPANSYDTNFHIFFASHYAQHWFNPWNEKWFAGFSQTTYPPLTHQWIAMISTVTGLEAAYMIVQLIAIVLLAVGVYRFSRLVGGGAGGKLCGVGIGLHRSAGISGLSGRSAGNGQFGRSLFECASLLL